MKKAIVALITLLLLLSPSSLIAAQDDKQPGVEKPKTKYEVAEKLYKEYNITPPSYYVPPADSYVEMDQKALDEFERLMRDGYERNKKVKIENEKKIKALEALDGVKQITVPVMIGPNGEITAGNSEITSDFGILAQKAWKGQGELTYAQLLAEATVDNSNGYWRFFTNTFRVTGIVQYWPYTYQNTSAWKYTFMDYDETCAVSFKTDIYLSNSYHDTITEYVEFYAY
ncbi:hypothetical protein [Desulfitobacterium sp. PCE1]|uniref:hypothetical protein n=1 Tax=Desulfitobacterium sp. PCE1 TaxID=146907 RepID=UPI0003732350|nr:hypothetical protein [Desulfitobacterium sp. PCE1]